MMRKRIRACEQCHRLKIKCELSIVPNGGACERCSRNKLECVPATPRLQRDRIEELEAQIQALRTTLQDRSNSTTPSWSPCTPAQDHDQAILSFLDARIPPSKQQHLLHLFVHEAAAAWPVICLPVELDSIRVASPVLLLSVMAHGVTHKAQGIELDTHDELVQETMRILGDQVMGRGQRSLQLVQALLVASFWHKSTRSGQQPSSFQIIQLAVDMAIDLGVAGFSLQPSAAAYFCRLEDPVSLEARRTWLTCFVALSAALVHTRRPCTVPWNDYHQDCLVHLETKGEPSDLLLCQIVRVNRLIQDICNHLSLCQLAIFVSGNDYSTYAKMDNLKNEVDAWVAQIPQSLASSQTLKVWRHMAMILVYESVLHTPTNMASFAAPFIPGRIAVNDFPKPANIILPLATALRALVQNCHAVIDTVAEMDPHLVLSLPSFCFAPTVLYALFVLVTTLVASTDPANTYGQCLVKDDFRIEQCSLKLQGLRSYIKYLDPTLSSFTARLFDATAWLEEWHNDYSSILQRYETNLAN